MGTWALHAFGNDDVADWLSSLCESSDLSVIDDTLSRVIATKDYLEAPDGEEGIAAAEVVARLQGRPDPDTPDEEELAEWISRTKMKPDASLARKAHSAIDRILSEPSELLELWQDSEEYEGWMASVLALKARVRY